MTFDEIKENILYVTNKAKPKTFIFVKEKDEENIKTISYITLEERLGGIINLNRVISKKSFNNNQFIFHDLIKTNNYFKLFNDVFSNIKEIEIKGE